jgi:ferrous iron transport protein B
LAAVKEEEPLGRRLTVALAGNCNVGKSVVFNQLTGLHQHVGNWPGKTVEKAEGTLNFEGTTMDVIDLPGIYSLSTYSTEERVTLEYIVTEKPDVVVNVVDASLLERNLYFTIQLLEVEAPLVVALNQMDEAQKKGISTNTVELERQLGVPVVPMIAVRGVGFHELMTATRDLAQRRSEGKVISIRYGPEVEVHVEAIAKAIEGRSVGLPTRFAAVRLLEGDEHVKQLVARVNEEAIAVAEEHRRQLEKEHGHSAASVVASERYEIVRNMVKASQSTVPRALTFANRLDEITTTGILGYIIMIGVIASMFVAVFTVGDEVASLLGESFLALEPIVTRAFGGGIVGELVWGGLEGLIAGITIALPYIVPFYTIMSVLEDSGYLARMAFMMDNVMHVVGLHGKAFIPLVLGYGCNVPACLGCRIMETDRERTLAVFLTTLIPCAGRTIVILGLVGRYVGIEWALGLYGLDLLAILVLGRLAYKTLPGEPSGLIMEVPPYRMPHLSTALKRTWFETSGFVTLALPLMVLGSVVLKALEVGGMLGQILNLLSPVSVGLLGLPPVAGVVLIFGFLRKELTLVMSERDCQPLLDPHSISDDRFLCSHHVLHPLLGNCSRSVQGARMEGDLGDNLV